MKSRTRHIDDCPLHHSPLVDRLCTICGNSFCWTCGEMLLAPECKCGGATHDVKPFTVEELKRSNIPYAKVPEWAGGNHFTPGIRISYPKPLLPPPAHKSPNRGIK